MIVNHIVEIDLDTCANTFGSAPCTASNAVGFECYNTKWTCQDEANYSKTVKTYAFSEVDNASYPDAIPCIEEIEFSPTEINPKEGLDYLGKLELMVTDFRHNDSGTDPYLETRPYIATDQGTFWGKFIARNVHYFARPIRVKQIINGAVGQTYLFVLESISPPDHRGRVKIVAKDPLFLTEDELAQVPRASLGKLAADITDTDTTLSLDDASTYPATGTVRIGNEIMSYAGKSGNDLTGLVRAQWGTEARNHLADGSVQICKEYVNEPLIDVVDDLISNYTPIDNTFIPYTEWQDEEADWLAVYTLNNVISEPTNVRDLLTEIQMETGTLIWWDQEGQKINLKAAVPRTQNESIDTLTDANHLMAPVKMKEEMKKRISQVWIYYGIVNYVDRSDPENFSNLEIRADYESEGSTEYGTESIEVIYSRWLTGVAQTGQVASRKLARYKNPPKTITFRLDTKDSAVRTGDHFYLQTAAIQSATGAPLEVEMQMLSMRYFPKTLTFECKAQSFNYLLNEIYAYVAPDGTPDYTSATDTQKNDYGFICDDDGEMATGEEGYWII